MAILSFSKPILERLSEELHIALKLDNTHLYRIVQALIWVGERRYSFTEIARLLNISRQTLYTWIKKFMCERFSWFTRQHYHGRGRKSRLTPEQREELYELIVAGPEKSGFINAVWNAAMIGELILLKFGIKYNVRYLSSLLKKMGLSYQKARFMTHHNQEEEYEQSRQTWVKETWPKLLEQAKETGAIILFGDEVSFAMWGSLARTWAPRGQQPEVKTTGIRKGLKMFGAIAFQSGDFQYKESLYYALAPKSLKDLKAADLPRFVLDSLKPLKNQIYTTQADFIRALKERLTPESLANHQEQILACAQTAGKFNGETYIQFLEQLLQYYSRPIILVEDGASYHRSQVVKTFKEQHKKRLTVEPLPKFSPDFNPIEKLWKNTKRDATHLKYFKNFEQLRDSVVHAFERYMEEASQVICVMKKLRFEAGITS